MYRRTAASFLPTVETQFPRAPKCCPTKFRLPQASPRAMWIALLPLMNPLTDATEYFGGTDKRMCTWSGIKCPSSTVHSFCSASDLNTVPGSLRNGANNALRRYFGMNTTWYLHSQVVCLRLS